MRKLLISYTIIILSLVCISAISAEDKITTLKDQISALEEQKLQLETEKQSFVNRGEELSYKIEELKIQSNSGLGIIGRYNLSRYLRKAQSLSDKIQAIDRNIYDIESQIKGKKVLLDKEYEYQINSLVKKLNGSSNVEEKLEERPISKSSQARSSLNQQLGDASNVEDRKAILAKIKEYQTARDQLGLSEQLYLGRLSVDSIEIKNYDSPKEIKEKADLISDLVNKTNTKISMLDSRIAKLKDELKTRKKLDEFSDEISFFNERVVRGEIASKSAAVETGKDNAGNETDKPATTETTTLTKSFADNNTEQAKPALPQTTTPQIQTAVPVKKVMKGYSVNANLSEIPQNRIDDELKKLEKHKQELKKELASLNEKASTFRKKADELEKSGKTSETQGKNQKRDKEKKARKKP